MARLVWNAPGERFYETGVDHGVLYIDGVGTPWNGLVSVDEKNSGGQTRETFLDGVKIDESKGVENFEATLRAFSSPLAFDECDGTLEFVRGLIATNQRRKPFGLVYRSLVGNDIAGDALGYKIHIIYNAYVGVGERSYESVTDTVNPTILSWPISAIPVEVPDIRRTAHFILDSTRIDPVIVAKIEDMLFGSDFNDAYLPEIGEIVAVLEEPVVFEIFDNGDGTFTAIGPPGWVDAVDSDTYTITSPTIEFIDDDTFTVSSV